MANLERTQVAAEWRASWPLVLSALFGMILSSIHLHSIGVMMEPLEKEFGWTRTQISSGPAITAVIAVVFAPFMGMAIDRWGPRRIALLGIVLMSGCFASLALAQPAVWTWWLLWALLAFASLFTKPTVWTAAVSSAFNRGRGFALAVILCGAGLGGSIVPMGTYQIVANFGWRVGYIGLGLFSLAVIFPLAVCFFRSGLDRRRGGGTSIPASSSPGEASFSRKEALRSWTFIRLGIAAFLTCFITIAISSNLVPILRSHGMSGGEAAGIAGIAGVCTIVGRLSGGIFLDRYRANFIAGLCVIGPAVSFLLLLLLPGGAVVTPLAVAILGASIGAELDAVAYLVGRHFGLENFGLLFGTIAGLLAFAGGTGPLLASFVYDMTGSYDLALGAFTPVALIAALLFFSLGSYAQAAAEPTQAAS